jgi:hypothetical protein
LRERTLGKVPAEDRPIAELIFDEPEISERAIIELKVTEYRVRKTKALLKGLLEGEFYEPISQDDPPAGEAPEWSEVLERLRAASAPDLEAMANWAAANRRDLSLTFSGDRRDLSRCGLVKSRRRLRRQHGERSVMMAALLETGMRSMMQPGARFLTPAVFAALLYGLGPAAHADEPDSCALQYKDLMTKVGTPEYAEASEHYKNCSATAAEQKKQHFVETAATWATSLEPMPAGGWGFLEVSADGTLAIFGSRRHATREGNVTALWFRYEYRESQSNGNESYKSAVQRQLYDCARMSSKVVSIALYRESNLSGEGSSNTFDESKIRWAPVIPGTMGDFLLDWACKAAPRAQSPKQQ